MIKIDRNMSESGQIVRKNKFNVSVSVVLFLELFISGRLQVRLTVMQIVNIIEMYVYIFCKNVVSSFVSFFRFAISIRTVCSFAVHNLK